MQCVVSSWLFAILVLGLVGCGAKTRGGQAFGLEVWQSLFAKDCGHGLALNTFVDDVDTLPEYPGGRKALECYLAEELVYPGYADMAIEGRVWVGFIVELDGSLSHLKVLKGLDPDLDKEALRLVGAMPRWRPAHRGYKAIRARFVLPIAIRKGA